MRVTARISPNTLRVALVTALLAAIGALMPTAVAANHVKARPVAPSITAQPIGQTVTAGQAASFSVTTTGSTPMSYQWKKNGVAISGATSSSYQTPAATLSDNGSQFSVTVSNTVGTATSSSAILKVNSPGCSVSSTNWVNSSLPLETGTFRLAFDATPSSAGVDGVIGLSAGPASAYTSLAAMVRFNSTGTVDARNGAAYTAATAIPYAAATTYHFIMDVNIITHAYDAYVVVGGTQMLIGSQLAFRTEQAAVSSLSNLAAIASQGTQTICNVVVSGFAPGCSISSTNWVNSSLPSRETGTFRIAFDATPSSVGVDGVIGLSAGPASDYTSLAAMVRFNSTGTIDARNGAAYTAATTIPYAAATTYHFIMNVNITTHTYDAYVVVGGTQLVIGSQLAFRTEQAAVSSLNNLAAVASQGSQTVCNVVVSAFAPGCSVSSTNWVNSSLPLQETGSFRLAFDATPSSAGVDGVIGLSAGPASDYTSLAAIVRFNSTGTIDARNGAAYTAATTIPYAAATTYHFIMDVNITAHTYDAYVVVGGSQMLIGSQLAFRTEQAGVSSLNNLAAVTSQGSQTVCNVAVSAIPLASSTTAPPTSTTPATSTAQPTSLLLTPSSTQVNFGSVNVSSSASKTVTLTNTGNSNVTVSNVVVAGAGFNATGGASGLILSPGQAATVTATFSPAAAGTLTGSLTVPSNASNSPSTIALTGTGMAQPHSVNLSWMASTSAVIGYNVYSSHVSGGPYVKLNSTPIATSNYTDATVQSAQTYFYVATAVATNNSESGLSPEVSAVVP